MTHLKRGRYEATDDNVETQKLPYIRTGSYAAWKLRESENLWREWIQSKDTNKFKKKYTGFEDYTWQTFKEKSTRTRGDSGEDDDPENQSGDESGYESNEADVEPGPSPAKKKPKKKMCLNQQNQILIPPKIMCLKQ